MAKLAGIVALTVLALGGLIQAVSGEQDENCFEVNDSMTGYSETVCRDDQGGIYNP